MTDLQRVVVRRPGIPKLGSLVVRFLEKVKIEPGGCWLWQGEIAENGRGGFRSALAAPFLPHDALDEKLQ